MRASSLLGQLARVRIGKCFGVFIYRSKLAVSVSREAAHLQHVSSWPLSSDAGDWLGPPSRPLQRAGDCCEKCTPYVRGIDFEMGVEKRLSG